MVHAKNSPRKRRQRRDVCDSWVFDVFKSCIQLSLNIVKKYADRKSRCIGNQRRYTHQAGAICEDTTTVTTLT